MPTTPEVRFNLRSYNEDNTLIVAIFRYKEILKYSTKLKIPPKFWNKNTSHPRTSFVDYRKYSDDLTNIKKAIINIYQKNNRITKSDFKTKLDIALGRTEIEYTNDLIDFIWSYSSNSRIKNLKDEKTIRKYEGVARKLEKYSRVSSERISYEHINHNFSNNYVHFLYTYTGVSSQNTANKELSTLAFLLKEAKKEGLHNLTIYEDEDFLIKRVKTTQISLTEDELKQLWKFNNFKSGVSSRQGKTYSIKFLKEVRDWFVVCCDSSMRWQDFSTFNNQKIYKDGGDSFIHIWTDKGDEEVFIPIEKRLISIFEEYDYCAPKMSQQNFNDAIKLVCEQAGIVSKVQVNRSVKGKQIRKVIRKCDEISAHDGRRTWATIKYLKGFAIGLLMQVTGHKKESTFLNYISISKLEMAKKLMKRMKANDPDNH